MILFPPAKINLGLHVLGKRPDGYHALDSVLLPIPWYDVLEILPADTFSFRVSGLPVEGDTSQNLVVKAYELMREKFELPPVYIHLRKEIPMGAGLGGGSSDATSTLLGLNTLFELGLAVSELEALAAQLGSDCPFFVTPEPKHITGRGEYLSPVDVELKEKYIKVVFPQIHISTHDAFQGVTPYERELTTAQLIREPLATWQENLRNDFETSLFPRFPLLEKIKQQLISEGAQYASLTGSGSALYGIFHTKPTSFSDFGTTRVMKLP
jgi:4-diphosphocytidyl-2-C-methyl-D-erythritol kinase